MRVDQQRGLHRLGVGRSQQLQFAQQVVEQTLRITRRAFDPADLLLHVHRLGEGAQVQADDGLFEPVTRGGCCVHVNGILAGIGARPWVVRAVEIPKRAWSAHAC